MNSTLIADKKSDEDLVKMALANSREFSHLVYRYESKLLSYIKRVSGLSLPDAEDVLQEAFIKIYYNLHSFDAGLKFSSWAYRITRNEVVNDFRRRKSRGLFHFSEFTDNVMTELVSEDKIGDKIDSLKRNKIILEALNALDEKYREVLELKFFEEKDYREISDILKKPIGTVGTLINRAKKNLKKHISLQSYERNKR